MCITFGRLGKKNPENSVQSRGSAWPPGFTRLIARVHEDGLRGRGDARLRQRPAVRPRAPALQLGVDVGAVVHAADGGREGLVVALHLAHLQGQLPRLAVRELLHHVAAELAAGFGWGRGERIILLLLFMIIRETSLSRRSCHDYLGVEFFFFTFLLPRMIMPLYVFCFCRSFAPHLELRPVRDVLGVRVVEAVEVQRALGAVGASAQALRDGREPEPLVGEVAGLSRVRAHGEVALAPTLEGKGQARSLGVCLTNRSAIWLVMFRF